LYVQSRLHIAESVILCRGIEVDVQQAVASMDQLHFEEIILFLLEAWQVVEFRSFDQLAVIIILPSMVFARESISLVDARIWAEDAPGGVSTLFSNDGVSGRKECQSFEIPLYLLQGILTLDVCRRSGMRERCRLFQEP
jgi:hypothetical protein